MSEVWPVVFYPNPNLALAEDVVVEIGSDGEIDTLVMKGLKIENVVFNGPACIVFWNDGKKTVLKRMDIDEFDPYSAVAQAVAKRVYGSTGKFHKMVDDAMVINDNVDYEVEW